MPDMSSISFDALYVLMKGEPGLRKSTSALSFPTPQYWFSTDLKMEGLHIPMSNWGINVKDIQFDDYTDWNGPRKKLEELRVNCPFRTVIIDSITSFSDAVNRQTRMIKQGAKGETGKTVAGIPVNSIEDFNAEDSVLKEVISLTKDINRYHKVNIVLIGHVIQRDVKSPSGQTHVSRTILTGGKAVGQKIPAYCTEVYHFNIKTDFDASKGGAYALKTTHTGDDFARTSLRLPQEIVFGDDPLYEKWIKPAIEKTKPPTTTEERK